MSAVENIITDNLPIWSSSVQSKSSSGRGTSSKRTLYGVKKLRELILDLAVRGLLVPQDPNDEPASVFLENIAAKKEQLIKQKVLKNQKPVPLLTGHEFLSHIPVGWELTSLSQIAQIQPKNDLSEEINVGFVEMSSISTMYDGSHTQEVRKWLQVKKGYTHIKNGDIGLAKVTPCFENSKAAIFKGLINGFGAATTELHVARLFGNQISADFILYHLKSVRFLSLGKARMTGTSGLKRVPKEYFAGYPILLPPEAEQHRIVAKVDELMALCDTLEQQQEDSIQAHEVLVETLLEALTSAADADASQAAWQRISEHFDVLFTTEHSIDKLKETILQLAVMGKLVPQDPNDEPAKLLSEEIAANKMLLVEEGLKTKSSGKEINTSEKYICVPNSWECLRLGDMAKFIDYRGRTPKKTKAGTRLITAKNIKFGYLSLEPEEFIAVSDYSDWMTRGIPQIGDVLFTTEAPLGNVAIIDLSEKFALAQRAICLQFHVSSIGRFVALLMMSIAFQSRIKESASGMTATGIKSSALKEVCIALPPLAEQYRIVAKVNELMALCDQLKGSLHQVQQTQIHLTDAVVENAL